MNTLPKQAPGKVDLAAAFFKIISKQDLKNKQYILIFNKNLWLLLFRCKTTNQIIVLTKHHNLSFNIIAS
jgi:hypothetical protein